jgi:hypothetical protein
LRSNERAAQIWPVLVFAALNRQTLTYETLGKLIGVPKQGLGPRLEPIQAYCQEHGLPALTSIVVGKGTGVPGEGSLAAQNPPPEQARVFSYPWLEHEAPTPESFS